MWILITYIIIGIASNFLWTYLIFYKGNPLDMPPDGVLLLLLMILWPYGWLIICLMYSQSFINKIGLLPKYILDKIFQKGN